MKKYIIIIVLAVTSILSAQEAKADSTTSKTELIKKYESIINDMQTQKQKRIFELCQQDVIYNRLDAIEFSTSKLLEEIKKESPKPNK